MRREACLLVLAGCGRLAFDAAVDATDDAPLPPGVCAKVHTPIDGIGNDMDLVATALRGGGTMVAWVAAQPTQLPTVLRLDAAGNEELGPQLIDAAPGNRLGSLVELGAELYLQLGDGNIERYVAFDRNGGSPVVLGSVGVDTVEHDCLLSDFDGTKLVYVFGNDATVNIGYATTTQLDTYVSYDTGSVFDKVACHPGQDHAHVQWETSTGDCASSSIDLGPVTPTFGSLIDVASDCRDSRAAPVTYTPDTAGVVYRNSGGQIMSTFITGYAMPAIEVSPSGRAPRVQSDGTRIWFAWLDTRTGSAELHVGYRLPMGGLAHDVVLTGVVPAGDGAFELVRDGATIRLAVLTQSELVSFQLCP